MSIAALALELHRGGKTENGDIEEGKGCYGMQGVLADVDFWGQ